MASNTEHLNLLKKDPVADGNEYFNIETMLNENWDKIDEAVSDVQNRLNRSSTESITLQPGLQTINAERDALFKLGKVRGRTMINLLGNWGGCEGLNPRYFYNRVTASIDTTIKKSGSASLKVVADTSADTTHYYRFAGSVVEDCYRVSEGEYILFGAWIKPQSIGGAHMTLFFWNDTGTENVSGIIGGSVIYGDPSKFAYGYVKAKVPAGARYVVPRIALVNQNGNENFTGTGVEGCNIDEVSIYKLSDVDYAELDRMTNDQIADKYPYVPAGIVGVENPYAISTSGNLLPPFYEWRALSLATGATHTIDEPYKMTLNDPGQQTGEVSLFYTAINVPANTDITLKLPQDTWNTITDATGDSLYYPWEKSRGQTINTGNNTQIRVYLGNRGGAGVYTFENPMLVPGTEPKPFQPQCNSMLAFQTELHANLTDGSDSDVLFEQDGEYRKLEKWKKLLITGDYGFAHNRTQPGYKSIRVSLGIYSSMVNGDLRTVGTMTKYDGTLITKGTYLAGADKFDWDSNNGYVLITVANTDSGWGDNYTQVDEGEIKAYFNGWKMYRAEDGDGNISTSIYNGTGTKKWARRSTASAGWEGGTVSLPTTQAPINEAWSPYNLLYRRAKENVESVTVEGCLTLSEGDNMVKVGTGIVMRERVTPFFVSDGNYYINKWDAASSHLKYKTEKIVQIYNDNKADFGWTIQNTPADTAGNMQRALINASRYDQSAAYSVTYTKLDKSPIIPITGALAVNEKAQLSDLTAGVAEALQRVSVVEIEKAEKDAPSQQWIKPTLLNGWTSNNVGYKKIGNLLLFKGTIIGGSVGAIPTFILPQGYRPKENRNVGVLSRDASLAYANGRLTIYPSGEFTVDVGPNGSVYLDGLIISAEQ